MAAKQVDADDKPLPEIVRLRGVEAVVDLRDRTDEYQYNGEG
jgi:hypothetical protein